MRLGFLELQAEERRLYIEQAAVRGNISAVMLEKDFWVCWLLGVLFGSEFAGSLVFKGGTSLSKVFGVIDRFSEDIDLSLSPEFLRLPAAGASRNQAQKWLKNAEATCGAVVEEEVRPKLEDAVAAILGKRDGGWFDFLTDPATDSPVLLFHYPSTQPSGFAYLKHSVKLEFGSLTDQQPVGRHPIVPLAATILPEAFGDWRCDVVALEVERSFWEKATILHTEYHRPAGKPTPDRFSRHYADTAALAGHPNSAGAVDRHDLRERVVAWKGQFFGSGWARYDLARPGTFCLVPPPDRIAALRHDYDAMRNMYFSEPASFDAILEVLAELEQRINAAP